MKVLEFLETESICLDLKSTTKEAVLREMVGMLSASSKVTNPDVVMTSLMDREKLGSTGIGQGVAIPHGKSDATNQLIAALGLSKKGIDFESLDGEPVHIVFLLVSPLDSSGHHLKVLARISRLLKDKFFRQAIREAKSSEEISKIIREEDEY